MNFQGGFFPKILPLSLFSIQEQVMMVCLQYMYAMYIIEKSITILCFYKVELKMKVKWLNDIWINTYLLLCFIAPNKYLKCYVHSWFFPQFQKFEII